MNVAAEQFAAAESAGVWRLEGGLPARECDDEKSN